MKNPDYMKDKFVIRIETMHLPDRGETENVLLWTKLFFKVSKVFWKSFPKNLKAHELPPEMLAQREVIYIDIANDTVDPKVLVAFKFFTDIKKVRRCFC